MSVALLVTAASGVALVGLRSAGLPPVVHAIGIVALLPVFMMSTVVALGGLVCLWRDDREAAGRPDAFAIWATATPAPGLASRLGLRVLLGSSLRRGDYVRVKSLAEIEATLDADRALNGLPFMTEMDRYCGGIFRVHRRIDKINDMRHKTGLRRLRHTVTLTDVRCDGSGHGDCQAACQILWKEAWLDRLSPRRAQQELPVAGGGHRSGARPEAPGGGTYVCQMTQLWFASSPMSRVDVRQDLRPLLSGNIAVTPYVIALLTRLFNVVQRVRGGAYYPAMPESRTTDQTPLELLPLAPGEPVTIRRKEEIAQTLVNGRTRGLWFDRDMIRFCGQPATVRTVVSRIIHEATGEMVVMRWPSVMLQGMVATGEFLRLCPQHEYILWRERWVDRRLPTQLATPFTSQVEC